MPDEEGGSLSSDRREALLDDLRDLWEDRELYTGFTLILIGLD
jgi:hypothetical protein